MVAWETPRAARRRRKPIRWQDAKSLWSIRHDAVSGAIQTVQLHRGVGQRACYADEDGHARALAAIAGRRVDFRVAHISFVDSHLSLVLEAGELPPPELRRAVILAARRLHYECWRWQTKRLGEIGKTRYAQHRLRTIEQVCACIQVLLDGWRDHRKEMTLRDARRCVALYGTGELEEWRMKSLPI